MDINIIKNRLKKYANVDISLDLKSLPEDDKKILENLIESGKIADLLFWRQSAQDALSIREHYKNQSSPLKEYIEINYGPYDRLHGFERFVGEGPDIKPPGAGFYPEDFSREEFIDHVERNPEDKEKYENLYTVIYRDGHDLKAEFYHQIYQPEVQHMATYLEKSADFTQNRSLRLYLQMRSQALKNDQYYESDISWMNLKENLIDIVIGPIENYEDRLFNYKAAYEAAVMIKDLSATEELAVYKKHLKNLEVNLPIKNDYKKVGTGTENILEIVNIAYFGGDYQAGVKTIAASLPNDEKVISEKGAKKQLYKNILEAKFEQILVPITNLLMQKNQKSFLSKKRFISQVLLHEISHTIGPNYVIGKSQTVRKSLKEKYSIVEECKADILGIYSVPYFADIFSYTKNDIAEHYITYVAGLFRSIRFGVEEAHGLANLIQLNFLTRHNVVCFDSKAGTFSVNMNSFYRVVKELARIILMIEAHGDYEEALKFIDIYGQINPETRDAINRLEEIPTDLNLYFKPIL